MQNSPSMNIILSNYYCWGINVFKQPDVTGHGGNNVLLLCILVGSLVYIET